MLIKVFNFLNPFYRKISIHIVDPNFKPYFKGAKLTHIPRVGEKIFFDESSQIFDIRRVLHFYNYDRQVVYIIVDPTDMGKAEVTFDLNG
tara:strand:- start:515 stop:784 length:270 start_codon:yes stop_codon:yes gene_type:complete